MYKDLDTINLNNIYNEVYSEYDIIISDTNLIIPNKNKPQVFNTNDQLFSEKLLIDTISKNCHITNDIFFDEIVLIDLGNLDYEAVVSKMLGLIDQYAEPTKKQKDNILDKNHRIYDYKGSIHYIHYHQKSNKSVLIMGKIGDNCRYREMKIDRMFIVIFGVTPQKLKYYNYVTALLATRKDVFNHIYQNPNNDYIIDIVNENIDLKLGVR